MPPSHPTLLQLQDTLAIAQAQSAQNDATYTSSSALELAQYNQRKHSFEAQIESLQSQISKLNP